MLLTDGEYVISSDDLTVPEILALYIADAQDSGADIHAEACNGLFEVRDRYPTCTELYDAFELLRINAS